MGRSEIRRRRRNKRRERAVLIFLVLFMGIIIGGGFYLFNLFNRGPVPNFEFVSLSSYREIEPGTYIVLGDKILFEYEVLVIDNSIFIPLDFLMRFNGPHLHFEPYYSLVTLTTQTEMTRIEWPSEHIRDEIAYISTSNPLINRFDIDIIYAFNGGDITFVVVTDIYEEAYFTTIRNLSTEDIALLHMNEFEPVIPVRYEPYITSYVSAWVSLDSFNALYLYPYEYIYNEEESFYERVSRGGDDFTRVRTSFGEVGFIETKYLEENSVRESRTRQPEVLPSINNIEGPITIAWDNIQHMPGNYFDRYRVVNRGVNVFAPKWMRFGPYNRYGTPSPTLSSIASHSYVEFAHANGVEVWPLLFDYQVNYVSSVILADPNNRDYIINQLMELAYEFNFDGIMIDIEGLVQANFENFAQFVRELSPFMRERGLAYSVAVFVPRWRPWLDHNELARVSDFLAVMAYDENMAIWRDSGWNTDEIGPNASISFVYETIENMLWQGVPPERLILGVPFYTRIWATEFYGDEILEDDSNVIRITTRTVYLAYGMNHFINNGANIVWDDEAGSYRSYFYGTREGNNARFEAWIESERSLVLKTEMARSYNLAGIAAWRRGMETPPIWDAIYYALR